MPDAVPLRSGGNTRTIASASAGLMNPIPAPADEECGQERLPVVAGLEAVHQEQAHAHERQAGGEQRAERNSGGQATRERRDDKEREHDRQQPQPGLERSQVQDALEVQRREEQERVERHRLGEGHRCGPRERPIAQQPNVEHRLARAQLDEREGHQQRAAAGQAADDQRRSTSPPRSRGSVPGRSGTGRS